MAAKSILNELYQRLRTAAPVYKTQQDPQGGDGFLCTLTLPAVQSEWQVLSEDKSFQGNGSSKKEAEHAAAHAAVEFLTAERVLRPDLPTGSQGSKGGSAAAASPSVSSATSGITPPGVGSKRSKSNTDDEEATESLELRLLEALVGVYPRTLNGAQLAKLCGHFKLKSKVNHLLYMKLRVQGLVELLDSHPPAWRAAGPAITSSAAAAAVAACDAAAAGKAILQLPSAIEEGAGLEAANALVGTAAQAPAGSAAEPRDAPGGIGMGAGSLSSRANSPAAGGQSPLHQPQGRLGSVDLRSAAMRQGAKQSRASCGIHSGGQQAAQQPSIAQRHIQQHCRVSLSALPHMQQGQQQQQFNSAKSTRQVQTAIGVPLPASAVVGHGGLAVADAVQQHALGVLDAQQCCSGHNSVTNAAASPALAAAQVGTPLAFWGVDRQSADVPGAAAGNGIWSALQPPLLQEQQQQQQQQYPLLQRQAQQHTMGIGLLQQPSVPSSALLPAVTFPLSPSYSYGHATAGSQGCSHHQSYGPANSLSHSQPSISHTSCGRSTTAATAAAARKQAAGRASGIAAGDMPAGAAAAAVAATAAVGLDSDTDDDDISPAVLAAASEAASLEPAPVVDRPGSTACSLGGQALLAQQQVPQKPKESALCSAIDTHLQQIEQLQQQQQDAGMNSPSSLIMPHLDLLAAMQLNEPQHYQQQQQNWQQHTQPLPGAVAAADFPGLLPFNSAAAPSAQQQVLDSLTASETAWRNRIGSKPQVEAGMKRKYPAFSSNGDGAAWQAAAGAAAGAGPGAAADLSLWPATAAIAPPPSLDSCLLGTSNAPEAHELGFSKDPIVAAEAAGPPQFSEAGAAVEARMTCVTDRRHPKQLPCEQQCLQQLPLPPQSVEQLQHLQQTVDDHPHHTHQQQQHCADTYDVDEAHQHPQRRRRRSGQNHTKPSEAAVGGAGPHDHLAGPQLLAGCQGLNNQSEAPAARVHRAASASQEGSGDLPMTDGTCTAAAADTAAGRALAGAAAADLAAALLHLSAGTTSQTSAAAAAGAAAVAGVDDVQQLPQQGLFGLPVGTAAKHVPGLPGAAGKAPTAAAALWQGLDWAAGQHQGLAGSFGLDSICNLNVNDAAVCGLQLPQAASNPWVWRWQGQQGWPLQLQQHTGNAAGADGCAALASPAATAPAVAADSDCNGSCVGWPANSAGASSFQQQQQHALFAESCQQQVGGAAPPAAAAAAAMAGPVGSAAGSLGRGSPCSGQRQRRSASPSPSSLSMGASVVAGSAAGPAGAGATSRPLQQGQPQLPVLAAGLPSAGIYPGEGALVDLQKSEEQALQLLSRLALPRGGTHAAASDAHAAGLSAAVIAAAGTAPVICGDGPGTEASAHKSPPLAVLPPAVGGQAAAASHTRQPYSSTQQDCAVTGDPLAVAVAAAAAAAKAAAVMAAAAASLPRGPPAVAVCDAGGSAAEPVIGLADTVAITSEPQGPNELLAGAASVLQLHQQTTGDVGARTPDQLALLNSVLHTQQQPLPAVSAMLTTGVPAHLKQEYDRRVVAVRELVQQLNEALQGLNSIREQVEGSGA